MGDLAFYGGLDNPLETMMLILKVSFCSKNYGQSLLNTFLIYVTKCWFDCV